MSEALLLKVAIPPTPLLSPPSPRMLNSAIVQPDDALTELSPARENAVPPIVMVMLSAPAPAAPVSVTWLRLVTGTAVVGTAPLRLVNWTQSGWPLTAKAWKFVGHVVPKSVSQYWMKARLAPGWFSKT